MTSLITTHGVAVAERPLTGRVLRSDALELLVALERRFAGRRAELLAERDRRQHRLEAGELPDFLAGTASVRTGAWRVAPAPAPEALWDRRVEITGPRSPGRPTAR